MKACATLVLAGVLAAGCSAPEEAATANDAIIAAPGAGAPSTKDVPTNLARLKALNVFEVGAIIENIPQTGNCYNRPCPWDVDAAKDAAAVKLGRLTDKLVAAAAEPVTSEEPISPKETAANLSALRALKVVTIGQMIVDKPKNNPQCYNLPCPEDIEAADAKNEQRAGQLANMVEAL